jgi:hypothetical protein
MPMSQINPDTEKQQLISFFMGKNLSLEEVTLLTDECSPLLPENSAQEIIDGVWQLFTKMTFISSNYPSLHTCIRAYSDFFQTFNTPPTTEEDYTKARDIAHSYAL